MRERDHNSTIIMTLLICIKIIALGNRSGDIQIVLLIFTVFLHITNADKN